MSNRLSIGLSRNKNIHQPQQQQTNPSYESRINQTNPGYSNTQYGFPSNTIGQTNGITFNNPPIDNTILRHRQQDMQYD